MQMYQITKVYKVTATSSKHAVLKLKKSLDEGFDKKYLSYQKIVLLEEMPQPEQKHPWIEEILKQLFSKK